MSNNFMNNKDNFKNFKPTSGIKKMRNCLLLSDNFMNNSNNLKTLIVDIEATVYTI